MNVIYAPATHAACNGPIASHALFARVQTSLTTICPFSKAVGESLGVEVVLTEWEDA